MIQKKKYKLTNYNYKIKISNDEERINYGIETLDNENYEKIYNILLKSKNENEFKNKIEINEFNEEEDSSDYKLKFDNFYMVAFNLILSNLKKTDFEETDIYKNFFFNVCVPLYQENEKNEDNKLFELIQFLFNPTNYKKIKKNYGINPKYIDSLLYGFRYCLNEIAEKHAVGKYLFSTLYDGNIQYLKTKFYPGSDTKDEPYYDLYYKVESHFKEKPNEGCYICLCTRGYYHSIPSGYPGYEEKDLKCPYCDDYIGTEKISYIKEKKEKENKVIMVCEPVKRDKYFRIFSDENESRNNRDLSDKINHMTKEKFKEEYIINLLYTKEKGLNEIDESRFKNDNKIIRNLSKISFRLLNYILYSHLFFARLLTDSEDFDYYLPKLPENEKMTWFNTINECFTLLEKELEKEGIKKTEIFMNVIFKDLFNKLHNQKCIDNYDNLIKFEQELEILIQEKIKESKKKIMEFEKEEKKKYNNDKSSGIALLKEIYNKDDYESKISYYEYFFYTNYPDENYIADILDHKGKEDYPILRKCMEYKKNSKESKKNNDNYSLDNLLTFNEVLNLVNKKYSFTIKKDFAEKKIIKDDDIYLDNSSKFDDFIEIFNKFKLKDENNKKIVLNNKENCLCDFVLDDNNKYGRAYKKIYTKFIEEQNKRLYDILKIKSQDGTFNSNCLKKVNIQKIKEDEIFTDNLWEDINFIEIVFNLSYRKIIDSGKYENYNQLKINLDLIEAEMTNAVLKDKKLLNNEFIDFKYKDDIFSASIDDLITTFESKYKTSDLTIEDKVVIYDYINDYPDDYGKYKEAMGNFITLIEDSIKMKDEGNSKVNGDTNIYDIVNNIKVIKDDFKEIFKDKKNLSLKKLTNIYDYYLKLIFKYIKEDIQQYQKEKDEKKNPNYFGEEIIKKFEEIFLQKDLYIDKESLASAIRLFISVVLFREEDKENKIKQNTKNIVECLKEKDLWKNKNIQDEKFEAEFSKIKLFNIKINEILWFYLYLTDNKDEEFGKEVDEHLKNKNKPIDVSDNVGDRYNSIRRNPNRGNKRGKKNRKERDDTESESDSENSDENSDSEKQKKKTKNNKKK